MASKFRSTASRFVADLPLFLTLALTACSSDEKAHPGAVATDASTGGAANGDAGSGVTPAPEGEPYTTLAEWHLFTDAKKQEPSPGVVPYEVIAQLFSDYATKYRFIYVPPGKKIGYKKTEKWDLPVGTILVKTFSYLTDARDPGKGERILETRLLIHETAGWAPHTYVWNAEQTEATMKVGGDTIPSQFITASGAALSDDYTVPSENDCRTCHGRLGHTNTLGGRTRQLDRDHDFGNGAENQIDHLAKLGLFDQTPDPTAGRVHLVDPFGTGALDDRARSYLDGNCSQCHQPGDFPASSTGFWLDWDSTDPKNPREYRGVCKQPTAAGGATCGRQFDVVPGAPDQSILTCRIESTLAKERMPPVGRNLPHTEGVALLREWITAMPGSCSAAPPDAGADSGGSSEDSGTSDAASPNDAASASGG